MSAAEISRADVAHLARLARIAMSDDELDHLASQLHLGRRQIEVP